MKVHFICGYYSDLAHKKVRRPEDYWDAYFFCWAVKTGLFKRPFYIHKNGQKIRITKDNGSLPRKIFGEWLAERIAKLGAEGALIVPVPSKDAVVGEKTSRSLDMVGEALRGTKYEEAVFDGLRWSEKLAKAHEGGPRGKDALLTFLRAGDVKGKKVVLVDDLFSKGGHLLAAAAKLESAGATVLAALTCGRTVYDFETKPFGNQEINLEQELADWHA